METEIITGPSILPVSLNEVKDHLYIDSSDTVQDDYIKSLLISATSEVERLTGRRIITQTWKAHFIYWPCDDYIELPFGRLQSVTHVKYKDTDGTQSTFLSDYYIVDTKSEPGKIVLGYGCTWPSITLYPSNPIEVQFVCGFYHGSEWEDSTAYSENGIIIPTTQNGFAYQAGGDGTSGATEPTWPTTISGTVVDNDITWTCLGQAIPQELCHAIKIHVKDNFDNRGSHYINNGSVSSYNSKAFESLISPKRVYLKQRI